MIKPKHPCLNLLAMGSAPDERSAQLNDSTRSVLITGGAGFVGSNLAARLLTTTQARVSILDNFSREHVETNASWLKSLPGASSRLRIYAGDVRNIRDVQEAVEGVSEIYHLAAQVAVTTSVLHPVDDFQVNALGTLNVLEAARRLNTLPFFLFTSTNKVYGGLESLDIHPQGSRYVAASPDFAGIDENTPLDFHSPYGCSKGAADQYVRDYARIYGLPTVVFRMSCICGPRQFGTEDQGWVAHFLYSMLAGKDITIYGDGRQVRDILHVEDLIDAMEASRARKDICQGQVFNLGGGIGQSVSVNEMLTLIKNELGIERKFTHGEVRPGDQPLYIANTGKLSSMTGWQARRSILDILHDIHAFGLTHLPSEPAYSGSLGRSAAEGMVA